jgi:hypothetical protein
MKRILLILTICSLVSFKQKEKNTRAQFFPKAELKKENIPAKENLWVFILAGQSNMAGRALVEPQDTIPSDRILTINRSGEIIIAKEPLHFYEPSMTGLDCGLSFAKTIIKHVPESLSILLIPTAVGGSSISEWLGDSIFRKVQLLTNFSEKVQLGKKYGRVKGILWLQGESDANKIDIPLYKNRLSELFVKFRQIVGDEDLPILIGKLGAFSNNNGNWMKINEQINLYSLTDSNVLIINTSDLSDKGDKVHFNSEGQRILGQRFANEYIRSKK